MPEYVRCNLCGSSKSRIFLSAKRYNKQFSYVKCLRCGLIYLNPRLTKKELNKIYKQDYDYDSFIKEKKKIIKKSEKEIKIINKLNNKKDLLDIGCNYGFFLDIARKYGWKTKGVEISKKPAEYARKKGLDVFTGVLENAGFKKNSFDVITMWHVLEHIPDPSKILKGINRILKKDGLLVIAAPNINGFLAKIAGKRWGWLVPCEHLYQFSPKTIKSILEKTGFETMKLKTGRGDINFAGTWIPAPKVLRNFVNLSAKLACNFLIPFAFILWRLNKGEELKAYARKT